MTKSKKLSLFASMIDSLKEEGHEIESIAAALAYIVQQPKISSAQRCQELLEKELKSSKPEHKSKRRSSPRHQREKKPFGDERKYRGKKDQKKNFSAEKHSPRKERRKKHKQYHS